VGDGRLAVGVAAPEDEASQRQFCAISDAIFIYNLSYSTNNYCCHANKHTHTLAKSVADF